MTHVEADDDDDDGNEDNQVERDDGSSLYSIPLFRGQRSRQIS